MESPSQEREGTRRTTWRVLLLFFVVDMLLHVLVVQTPLLEPATRALNRASRGLITFTLLSSALLFLIDMGPPDGVPSGAAT